MKKGLLLGAGFKRVNAIVWVAVVEATTVLGGVLGLWVLRDVPRFWLGAVLAHAGGGFIFLAVHAVLGEMMKHGKGLVMTSFLTGWALIGVLNVCLRLLAL